MKKLLVATIAISVLIACNGKNTGPDATTTTSDDTSTLGTTLSALNKASKGVTSGGKKLNSSSLIESKNNLRSVKGILSSESTSSALTYCSQYGRAWNQSGNSARNTDEANYALHMIECTARIDESTETPTGFLTQIGYIACILKDAGAKIDTAGTYTGITVKPSEGSATCKALTKTNIKSDTNTYTFTVTVADNPNSNWDKSITLTMNSNPFYRIFMSQTTTALAIKAQGFNSGTSTPNSTIDVVLDQGTGTLLFEMTSNKNYGHTRMRLKGTLNSSFEFTNVSTVEGIKTICHTDGCNGVNSYEGATLKGTLPSSLEYEALSASNGTCNRGSSGCTASTGSNCTSGCITYGAPVNNDFINDENFATDIADITSGSLCFTSVTNSTAPSRSSLSSCVF